MGTVWRVDIGKLGSDNGDEESSQREGSKGPVGRWMHKEFPCVYDVCCDGDYDAWSDYDVWSECDYCLGKSS